MVNRQGAEDWSRFTGKLSTELEENVQQVVKQAVLITVLVSIFGFAFLAGTGALGLMFLNSIANSAWPNFTAFRPVSATGRFSRFIHSLDSVFT